MLHDFNSEFGTATPDATGLAARFAPLLGRDDQLVLLAEPEGGGGAVGFAYVTFRSTPYFDGPLAQLEELYVRPDVRDRGVGSALMQRVLDVARERGTGEMHINVDEGDADTRRFYEQRFGFSNLLPGTEERMLFYEREL